MSRLALALLGAVLLAPGCGASTGSADATPVSDAGAEPADAAVPPPDASTPPDVGFGLDLSGAQAVARTESFELVAIAPSGAISPESVSILDFESLRGRSLLIGYSGWESFDLLDTATGARVPIANATGRRFAGQNSDGDLVFEDGAAWRAATRTVEAIVPGNVSRVDHYAGNLALVYFVNGSWEAVDTVTGLHFPWVSTGGMASLGAHKALAYGGNVIDLTTGATHDLASGFFAFDDSLQDASGGAVFAGAGCPGGGLCSMGDAEAITALLTSEVDLRFSRPRMLGDGRYLVAVEAGVSQATLVVRGTDAKQVILQGIDISDFDVLDPWMLYTGLDQQGTPVCGRLDLSTGADLRLAPPEPLDKVRFLRP